MAKSPSSAPPTVPPSDFPLPLAEFCARLSATDKRVELIAAFHADEHKAGRLRDSDSAYRARFDSLAGRPAA